MSPLPGRRTERHDGRKVRNPMRAGSPETDQPTLPFRETSRPRWGETSSRPRVGRSAPRRKAAARTVGERALEGRTPGRPGAAVLTDPVPNPCREQGPGAGRAAPPQGGMAANARRAEAPRGAPPDTGIDALKGEAHGRSGASRAGRGGGEGRDGGSQTPDVARAGGGIRRPYAGPPTRECVVGHESPGEEASVAGPRGRAIWRGVASMIL
jgi:hypothetical protein